MFSVINDVFFFSKKKKRVPMGGGVVLKVSMLYKVPIHLKYEWVTLKVQIDCFTWVDIDSLD